MRKHIAIGIQDFGDLIQKDCFYIDKTDFIREWWECNDSVTLIARPRRFGKTLNMSMVEQYFSIQYADKGNVFEGLSIWNQEKYRSLQGTWPVISLSFATVKENTYEKTRYRICRILMDLYMKNRFLLDGDLLAPGEKAYFNRISEIMREEDAVMALHYLSDFLSRYYHKKIIILLDEYDTPMQEAYINGYWEELASFIQTFFNSTFKTNPWLERAIMTGVTRVSKESIFSDLNNLKVITTSSLEYATAFGFTEEEVFTALEEHGFESQKDAVKFWYNGFTFGNCPDIYNPWSILNFLDTGRLGAYWTNTSSNSLISKLIREGSPEMKVSFEKLLQGQQIICCIDEQVVYSQLDGSEDAVFSLLLASGYLKIQDYKAFEALTKYETPCYQLTFTNHEVERMFRNMFRDWFSPVRSYYNYFVQALLHGDTEAMNGYMNRVTMQTFRFFDTGKNSTEPERFYHGFVLGLIADLQGRFEIRSNRESGYGRYDVILVPRDIQKDDAIILEFKVCNSNKKSSLENTVAAALKQIEDKKYSMTLIQKGIPENRIHKYGFAFHGKQVLIG